MINIASVVLFFWLNTSSFASPNSQLELSLKKNELSEPLLQNLISTRCSRYLPLEKEKIICRAAVSRMLDILDYDVILFRDVDEMINERSWDPNTFVFIAFKQRLIRLLSSSTTTTYLTDLNLYLNQHLTGEENSENLWDFTKRYFKTDFLTAEALAVLFQDTTFRKLHITYLEEKKINPAPLFASNRELLSRVISTINLALDSSEELFKKLLYPAHLAPYFNRSIYQFYVPHFLSLALVKSGLTPSAGVQGALMLTLSYEFMTSSSDYRYLFSDPEKIDSDYKIKDIYAGFCGATRGAGYKLSPNFSPIQSSLKKSTRNGVNLLLQFLK